MSKNKEFDKEEQIRQTYRYDEMSNKVLRADKTLNTVKTDPVRDAETSQPKSMVGKIRIEQMGRALRQEGISSSVKATEETKIIHSKDNNRNIGTKESNKRRNYSKTSVLDSESLLSLNYTPKDTNNTEVYEEILQWTTELLGNDIPHDVILGTADFLIYTLKNKEDEKSMLIEQKRDGIHQELGISISNQKFQELIKLTQRITDFDEKAETNGEIPVALLGSDSEEEERKVPDDENIYFQNPGDESDEELETQDIQEKYKNSINDTASFLPSAEEIIIAPEAKNEKIDKLSIVDVDEFFLRRKVLQLTDNRDESAIQQLSDNILNLLANYVTDEKLLKEKLTLALKPEHLKLIQFIVENRINILWGNRLAKATPNEKESILRLMRDTDLDLIVNEYNGHHSQKSKRSPEELDRNSEFVGDKRQKCDNTLVLPELVDFDRLVFDQGVQLITTTKVELPEGSFKKVNELYEEIHVPPPKGPEINHDLVSVSNFPKWARNAFVTGETDTLNVIQSAVFPSAFENDVNMLICAPTGAGKTNVAIMSMLRTISKYMDSETNKLDMKQFKIVYIAPLKALVQEQVREFQRRLGYLGIKVEELTGDSNLTKNQISETQILVSTPEKWDVITRKASESFCYSELVQLIIIDEIHLLHDGRGPVIENIVARSFNDDVYPYPPRLVGLSATLPNYQDVAKFLRAPDEGVFFFDSSYRPCPLSQQFCGITPKNSMKRLNAINEACYNKALESVRDGHQVIIFVHSRKETARTAIWLKEKFTDSGNVGLIQKEDAGSKQILSSEIENVEDLQLQKVLQYGIGIHHAGLSKKDRSLSEDLFADGLLQILVSTATLAWGVNLPAHTVIVKGTDLYSPEKGSWQKLSPQDLLQMLGRAGRPRYDTHGEGIVITKQEDVQYYLAVLNQQLNIESQLITTIVDSLNAEVVAGNILSRSDAVRWIGFTYLYVRALVSPELYKVTIEENDPTLVNYRESLAHSAFRILNEKNMLVYNQIDGSVEPTELGRIASYFYVNHSSMAMYNINLSKHSSLIDLLRLVSMSEEFKYITIRREENKELKQLYETAPIPIKEDMDDPLAKTNILLQSYISRLKFDGFALNADMNFITQNAGRLLRALYELSVIKRLSGVAKTLLDMCKMVEKRMWNAQTPLRQFPKCPWEVIKKVEASAISWLDYLELETAADVGKAVRSEKFGKSVFDLIKKFPRIELKCVVQPLTSSLLKFELEVTPNWSWDSNLHGRMERFIILVEDEKGEGLLFYDAVSVYRNNIGDDHLIDFTLQLSAAQQSCLPPNFFVNVISDKWLSCDNQIAVKVESIRLPKKFPAPTPLLDFPKCQTADLKVEEFSSAFDFEIFNKFQSQVFESVYNSNDNVFVAATKGAGKTTIAELAILNHWRQNKGRIIYISPYQEEVDLLYKKWLHRFKDLAGGKNIGKLEADLGLNLKIISQNHLVLTTPEQFNLVSRKWRQRKNLQKIELIIYDNIHEIGRGVFGAVYETLISRMAFISNQLENELRVIALSSCLANGRDFAEWIGVSKNNCFNFSPHERVAPIEIHIQAFNYKANNSFDKPMKKLAFKFAYKNSEEPIIIFLPTKRSCTETGLFFQRMAEQADWKLFRTNNQDMFRYIDKLKEKSIAKFFQQGIGIIYSGMEKHDRNIIESLFNQGALSLLLMTTDCCIASPTAASVIVLGTQLHNEKEHHPTDYSANHMLEMVGTANGAINNINGKALILTNFNMKEYYKKFLNEGLPLESYMYFYLHELLSTEISSGIIQSKQDCMDWVSYTYFYRRIHANPSFYGLRDTSAYGISEYLTELIEGTLRDLEKSSIIEIEESENDDGDAEEISALNGCLISSHYGISFLTIHMFFFSLSRSSTLEDLLQILSKATEFEDITVNEGDRSVLLRLDKILPLNCPQQTRENIVQYKVFILLQAHFSRIKLPSEFKNDLKKILGKAIPLINAIVDILSGDGKLNAMTAMDISQMIIQGVWDTDNPIRQIPFFDQEILNKCVQMKVETVFDIMALEDNDRESIMTIEPSKLDKVAEFINNYPNIELEYHLEGAYNLKSGETNNITVTITRDEEPETLEIVSANYPYRKMESWWLILGELTTRELLAIKKISLRQETQKFDLDFTILEGEHRLTLWCVCDSYLDADKEVSFEVKVL